jgi:hypothetical protein
MLQASSTEASAIVRRVVILDTGLYVGHCRYLQNKPKYGTVDYGDRLTDTSDDTVFCDAMLKREDGYVDSAITSLRAVEEYISGACLSNPSGQCNSWYDTDLVAGWMDHGTHVASLAIMTATAAVAVVVDLQNLEKHGNGAIIYPPNLYRYNFEVNYRCTAGGKTPHHHTVYSLSWGAAHDGYYTDADYQLDMFVFLNEHATIVAAAGNSGDVYDSRVLSPCTGKNVLCVGAAHSQMSFYQKCHVDSKDYDVCWKPHHTNRPKFRTPDGTTYGNVVPNKCYSMSFSSRGTTADGRQGVQVYTSSMLLGDYSATSKRHDDPTNVGSCDETDTSTAMQGSSMSTPVVSGYVSLLSDSIAGPNRVCASMQYPGQGTLVDPMDCVLRMGSLEGVVLRPAHTIESPNPTPSSLLRAVIILTTTPITGVVGRGQFYDNVDRNTKLYHYLHANTAAPEQYGFGCSNIYDFSNGHPLPMFLFPESPQREFKVRSSRFFPLRLKSCSLPAHFPDRACAQTQALSLHTSNRVHLQCFGVDTAYGDPVKAAVALVWNDYPAFGSEHSDLVHDLALSVTVSTPGATNVYGGVNADVRNNQEVLQVPLPAAQAVDVLVFVQPTHLNEVGLTVKQLRYSLAVHGPLSLKNCPDACPVGLQVKCGDSFGIGSSSCNPDWTPTLPCTQYTQCYGGKWPTARTVGGALSKCEDKTCDPCSSHKCINDADACTGIFSCCCSSGYKPKCTRESNGYRYVAPMLRDFDLTYNADQDFCVKLDTPCDLPFKARSGLNANHGPRILFFVVVVLLY